MRCQLRSANYLRHVIATLSLFLDFGCFAFFSLSIIPLVFSGLCIGIGMG